MNLQDAMKVADPELTDALDGIVGEHVAEFLRLRELHPLKVHKPGYVSLSESFWLWQLACDLAPELIVESGTMDGWTAWWLRRGVPDSWFVTFDPEPCPAHLYHHRHAHYKCDLSAWSPVPLSTANSMIFFDDHQDQGERLRQAQGKGFREVVFHDVYPDSHLSLWRCGVPAGSVHQFPAIREPAIFNRPEHRQHRWLTWVRLPSPT